MSSENICSLNKTDFNKDHVLFNCQHRCNKTILKENVLNSRQNNFKHGNATEINENAIEILFSAKSIRRAFTRKVFTILGLLLAKTVGFSAISIYYEPLREFWEENPFTVLYPIPIYFFSALGIICLPSVRRSTPWNYINLLVFSTCVSVMIGGLSALHGEKTILIAFGITTVMVLGLGMFAVQTHWDFTKLRIFGFTFILLVVLTVLTTLSYLNIAFKLIGACFGVLIFCIYLITDIQQIINGNHEYKISPEDHILAVTILYLDVVNIFLNILKAMR